MSFKAPTQTVLASRFWILDIIRGLAILAVVCFHVGVPTDAQSAFSNIWSKWLAYGGTLGVSIFFVLSGFSIHLSQARKVLGEKNYRLDWGKFFRRRLTRLYPAYLGAIFLAIIINFIWALIRDRNPFAHIPTIWDFVSHLLLIHTLSPETFFGIIPTLWFIGVQVHIYLLYPIFWWLFQRWDINKALLVALLFTIAARLLSQVLFTTTTNNHPDLITVLQNNAPQRWFEWCFGAWVAQKVVEKKQIPIKYGWISLLFLILWVSFGGGIKLIYELVLGCLIGLIIWSLVTHQKNLRFRFVYYPFLYLGLISYQVYLLHQIFVPFFRSALDEITINWVVSFLLILSLVFVVTLPLSFIFNKLLKTPIFQPNKKTQT